MKTIGIRQVRVRTHDDIARIEVEPQDMQKLLANHGRITEKLQSYGYTFVTMDLVGYKSGSMNRALS
ncbi:ATP-utilizing enzyme of the PP-loop superfamily [Gracilibacillus boraciitolerans JCM 21714]|uniref:ATP-utilizing enzyme of the PP-loop superfamily n=1 Tax=Gracilibacillus boraciitolerans JCM 21714 TaxID=1298598 RepID=W4VFD4_9BACI|nr:ATP-utilizing enzyme of the PP-loop superfamily [Gracilibacillus boraciitolerans JCM 21714]